MIQGAKESNKWQIPSNNITSPQKCSVCGEKPIITQNNLPEQFLNCNLCKKTICSRCIVKCSECTKNFCKICTWTKSIFFFPHIIYI